MPTQFPTATSLAQPTPEATIGPATRTPRVADVLYVEESLPTGPNQLAVVDSASGEKLRTLPWGVPSPDWSVLYTVECQAGRTTVSVVAVATGLTKLATGLDGCFFLPSAGTVGTTGLSPNGRWLTLASRDQPPFSTTAAPGYQWQSKFAILDTTLDQPSRFVDLKGSFAYDAIDNTGQSLYLIEELAPVTPAPIGTRYQVRRYDLTTMGLDPGPITDKSNAEPIMAGLRQTSVVSADGQWLYSLYLNNVSGPFVHALNLANHFALCLDLPSDGKDDVEKQMLWTLAMSPDGRNLYAANGVLGLIAQVDPANASIRRTVQLPVAETATLARRPNVLPLLASTAEAKRLLLGGAAVTADGNTLLVVGESGLLSVGTDDLKLVGRLLPRLSLRSVAASPISAVIFAVPDDPTGRLLQIDPSTGSILTSTEIDHLWGILGVGPGVRQ
jgi:hypothetical protein